MVKLLVLLFFISLSGNIFSQDEHWMTIKDTVYLKSNSDKQDQITSIRIDSISICTGEEYIQDYPLHEVSFWLYGILPVLDYDIIRKKGMMVRVRFKCYTQSYTILNMMDNNNREIPISKYSQEWKYYLVENSIKNKIWNYVNNYFK